MPAFNAVHTLEQTVNEMPQSFYDEIIVVDDGSRDGTSEKAIALGLTVVKHEQNRGYGGAQKSGYKAAIEKGADAVVMVHADNQYDPTIADQFARKITEENYHLVTGTRMILGDALSGGMPMWKFIPNRFLTWLENTVFETNISDFHNGYRAYSTAFLKQVPLDALSEKFDFDTDIILQGAIRKLKIGEIPHETRFEDENSQMSFSKGIIYGLSILRTVSVYLLHRIGLKQIKFAATVNASK